MRAVDSNVALSPDPTAVLSSGKGPEGPLTISTDPFLTRGDQQEASAAVYLFLSPPQGPGEFGRLGYYRILGSLAKAEWLTSFARSMPRCIDPSHSK